MSFSGAFPAAQSVIAIAGDPSHWQKEKTTFQALKSCFLFSPSRHPCEQPVSFSGAFPAAQSVIAIAGDPSNWPKKKQISGPEKLFFIFTFQAPLRAASELFRCFSSCPKRNCNCGRPFQLAKEKTTFQALKSCSPPVR